MTLLSSNMRGRRRYFTDGVYGGGPTIDSTLSLQYVISGTDFVFLAGFNASSTGDESFYKDTSSTVTTFFHAGLFSSAAAIFGAGGGRFSGSSDAWRRYDSNTVTWNFSTADFMMGAWIKTSDASTNVNTLLSVNTWISTDGSTVATGSGDMGLHITATSKKLQFKFYDSGTPVTYLDQTAGPALNDGSSHFVAVARVGTDFYMYVDSTDVATVNSTFVNFLPPSGRYLAVGEDGQNFSIGFTGDVDEAFIAIKSVPPSAYSIPTTAFTRP